MSDLADALRPSTVLYTVWNMTGGPLSHDAQAKIEAAVERTIKSIEKSEGTRLLYQKVLA